MKDSYCKIHNTWPQDNDPCFQCVNNAVRVTGDELDVVVSQRDELLKACQAFLNISYSTEDENYEDVVEATDKARVAIAEVVKK